MAHNTTPSFTDYLVQKGRSVNGCAVCDLPTEILSQVNGNEDSTTPERALMLDWLAEASPDHKVTKFKLYQHRDKCLGLGRSTGKTGARA